MDEIKELIKQLEQTLQYTKVLMGEIEDHSGVRYVPAGELLNFKKATVLEFNPRNDEL